MRRLLPLLFVAGAYGHAHSLACGNDTSTRVHEGSHIMGCTVKARDAVPLAVTRGGAAAVDYVPGEALEVQIGADQRVPLAYEVLLLLRRTAAASSTPVRPHPRMALTNKCDAQVATHVRDLHLSAKAYTVHWATPAEPRRPCTRNYYTVLELENTRD